MGRNVYRNSDKSLVYILLYEFHAINAYQIRSIA